MAKNSTSEKRRKTGKRSKRGRRLLWLVMVVLAGVAVYYGPRLAATAEAGTAYMARVGCSCRYVAGRDIDSCATDRLAGMELITLVEDGEERSVTARFPLISSSTATYRDGYGCQLEPWDSD